MVIESIFMIRGGSFGFNWNSKLILSIFIIILVIYDWKKNERLDYFWIFLFGTIIWSLVEVSLQMGGTRIMPAKYLFGIEIPLWISAPLQGISEGSAVAVLGTFGADKIRDEETRKSSVIIFAIILFGLAFSTLRDQVQFPFVGLLVPSIRDMFPIVSIIFLSSMIAINIIFFIKAEPEPRKRGIYLFFVMLIFISVWTLSEWLAGTRWIEVGLYPFLSRAPPLIEFGALAYDVIVEIVLAYVPYLAIPYLLGLIE